MAITIHEHLKESTRRLHDQAEANAFQGALAQGKLPLPMYKSYLGQLANLHEHFERMLKGAATSDQLVASVVNDNYYQLPYLQADLLALGGGERAATLTCIHDCLVAAAFEKHPLSLLGVLYVLLGSKHGGKFIAANVKRSYALNEAGWTYFDPFGDRFRGIWMEFTASLNNLPGDEACRDALLFGANAAFNLFVAIGDDLWRSQQSTAALSG